MTKPVLIPAIAEDGSLYPVEKLAAHEKALFHLAVSVFVFSEGNLLIQRRALEKYHCGGMWANTCCTHPNWGGETQSEAASRRMVEEMGFTVPLIEKRVIEYSADVGNGLHEHELVTMFSAEIDRDTIEISPNPEEVCETRWVSAELLRAEIAETPEQFAPWFRIYMERFPTLEI
ncbi:MAG: NUDIX domain-containing protein [Pseudomonadota bacterium]